MAKGRKKRRARRPRAKPIAVEPSIAEERARPSRGAHLVAVLVLFHLCASCLDALPSVASGMDRRAWQDPRIVREMETWGARFGTDAASFEERIYTIAVGYHETRTALLTPFEPYLELTGVDQSWLMFTAGTVESDRFGVKAWRCADGGDCAWETLYLHGDDAHEWRRAQLGHPRVRSQIFRWGWATYRPRYEPGCRSIARLAFADFEDVDRVQCGFERTTLRSPDGGDPAPPEWGRTMEVSR